MVLFFVGSRILLTCKFGCFSKVPKHENKCQDFIRLAGIWVVFFSFYVLTVEEIGCYVKT